MKLSTTAELHVIQLDRPRSPCETLSPTCSSFLGSRHCGGDLQAVAHQAPFSGPTAAEGNEGGRMRQGEKRGCDAGEERPRRIPREL